MPNITVSCIINTTQAKDPAPEGMAVFSTRAAYNAYDRRANAIKPDLESYRAAKMAAPERAVALDPMEHGRGQEGGYCLCYLFGV